MSQHPITLSEVLDLPSQGISADAIKFGSTTMESSNFIVTCESVDGKQTVCMIDLKDGNKISRKPISAEAAIMNPVSKVLALRAGTQLQIFNLDLRAKMKSFNMSEPLIHWCWVSPNLIALITQSGVYHWSLEGDSSPQKLEKFDVFPEGTQVISYKVSNDGKWCLLIGIRQNEGTIEGKIHLYSVDKQRFQALQGHAGTFAVIRVPGRQDSAQVLIFQEKKPTDSMKIHVMELGRDKDAPGGTFRVAPQPIVMAPEAEKDFPVSMRTTPNTDIVFMITRMGYLFLFDIHTGKTIYRSPQRMTKETIFISTTDEATSGILGITARTGKVLRVTINKETIVPYIIQNLQDSNLAIDIAARLQVPGAKDLYVNEFKRILSSGDSAGAANLVKGWLTADKIQASEELGDQVAPIDINVALSVYIRANVPEKVIQCFLQLGEYDKIVQYAQKVNYRADYSFLLTNMIRSHPQNAAEFAKKLCVNTSGQKLIDPKQVTDIFLSMNRVQETITFLMEALKENKPEEGHLQTKLFEIILLGGNPNFASAILQNEMFSHYDRGQVAKWCEQAGLHQAALEHYSDISDIKRVIARAPQLQPEFYVTYFGKLSKDTTLECLNDMLAANLRQNIQLVVQVATKYSDQLDATSLIKLFEKFKASEGLFYYLGAIVNTSQEPDVHFKYIEVASKLNQVKEVERVCRDSIVYEAEKVKKFLMDTKLPDPKPLIYVCDRHGFIDEMTGYLYSNNLKNYIEVYVTKVSPQRTPSVIGKLLDLDCNEDFIRGLLQKVGMHCPVDELVIEVERRNRIKLLQPWLEALITTGNTETATHNAIGKIYVMMNKDPVSFLTNNQFYDPKVLGKYCEKLDPSLAFLAYRRGGGDCDEDLIRVTGDNGLYKDQARYLIEKKDSELWAKVLDESNPSRRALIDQVVQTALPETETAEEVSETVKAFMAADLSSELIELLERIVLQGSKFSNTRSLQNLLILTAIKSDKTKVQDYINRLDNFDGPEIAKLAAGEEYELFEEAFTIYCKFAKATSDREEMVSLNVNAVEILVDSIHNLDRAKVFAERVSLDEVWSKVGKAQLDDENITEAVNSYIKANDPNNYVQVIQVAQVVEDSLEDLVRYLKMVRKEIKEPIVDTEYIYSLAKVKKLAELEEFIAAPNVANIQEIGERLFDEGLFEAAKLLFSNINNNAKLALCYLNLKQYREAVDASEKANSISTWKEVNIVCLQAQEFRLAGICGLRIIVQPDHLEELIQRYEVAGHPTELMTLLEQGKGLEAAHGGIFTELAVLYTKYNPDELMGHLKIYHNRMNIPKVLRACEKALLWEETVFLYKEDQQPDNAVKTMIEHSVAFNNDIFFDCVSKARNQEIYYRSINFYLEQHPMMLEKLLKLLTPNLDHTRVVHQLRKAENLPLILSYLKDVQKENLTVVNEALNELYIDDEDYTSLRESIDAFDNFDHIALAMKIERHDLLELRRIAAYIYKKNKRWAQSVSLSKADKMYKDAIDTAAESSDPDLVEELLRFFVSVQDKECFAAVLYTCYELIRPDVAMELAWKNNMNDFLMPYMIQYMRHTHDKLSKFDQMNAKKQEEKEEEENSNAPMMFDGMMGGMGNGPMMLANEAFNPGLGAGGYPQGGMGGGFPGGGMGYPPQGGMGGGFPNQGGMGGYGGGMGY